MHLPNIHKSRVLVATALVVCVVATSGCSWFRKSNELYAQAPENRPLEVPPDLDLPSTAGTAAAPTGSVTASETVAAAAPAAAGQTAGTPSGFTASGTRDEVFARMDAALEAMEGVTVASRAQLLGAFDINYQGGNFLVRVSEAGAGAQVSVVDPRGMPASGPAAEQLIAQLQAALAAN
jgi:uncharacterized lipoprotein